MSLRRLPLVCLLLAACPPQTPPGPPPDVPPPIVGEAGAREGGPRADDGVAAPPAPDDPDAPDEPGDAEAGERPAPKLSAPRADTQLADTLPPPKGRAGVPGRRGSSGGCEAGNRHAGETWKVDCNECSCGDDGQVTCTAMACGGPTPAR